MPSTVVARPALRRAEEVDPRLVDGVLAAAMAVVVAVVAAADLEGTGRAGALAYLFAAGFGLTLLAVLGARDRSQLVVLAHETGLITPGR